MYLKFSKVSENIFPTIEKMEKCSTVARRLPTMPEDGNAASHILKEGASSY